MKKIFKLLFVAASIIVLGASCEKVGTLPVYAPAAGGAVLSASTPTIAAIPADSNKTGIVFTWTRPSYSVDSSNQKFIIEMSPSTSSFGTKASKTIVTSLTTSFTNKDINLIARSWGFEFNKTYDVDVRIISSFLNNNEQLASNVVKLKVTPYVVPPKVTLPSSKELYLVGSATAGGWGNPVPDRAQKFNRLDSVTYQGTFYLNGNGEYLMLPVNGDWSNKYSVANNSVPGLNAGGAFGYNLSSNFPGPAKSGTYTITADFQNGLFTVVKVSEYGLLWIPGDYQGWNPATAPQLGSPKADGVFEGYINFPAGGTFEFKMNKTPDWSNSLGDAGSGGLSGSGGNLKVPGAGYYKINANTVTNKWSATKTTWGLIGSFAPSNWGSDVNMTFDAGSNSWSGIITLTATDEFKFRANGAWDLNYGDKGADGSLEDGGDNIKGYPAGKYKVTLFLNNTNYYTYKVEKQ